ncbi:flagellin [Spirillospora albida]|uniref:flagellin N-terminal helical domain-containing protein n=1 Tax=Spirillospora albida TaxID=58123 RepID=UPI0004BFBB3D|nr:flagellin [Spirillospora albida]
MTYIRSTERSISTRVLNNLQGNVNRMDDIQQRLSSGKQLSRPSDSPAGTTSALQLRGDVRVQEQYTRNSSDALGWLDTIDTALGSMGDQLIRARDMVLQGMSSGAGGSTTARSALAGEIENLRGSLIGLANTTYLGRPVFGGATSTPQAYDADGVYLGDDRAVERSIGDNTKLAVNVDGEKVFGEGDDQLFQILEDVVDHLKNDPSALGDDLGRLDAAIKTIHTQIADVGARTNRVDQMRQVAVDRILTLKTQLSDIEDIDLPKTIVELNLQQTAYQAALAATARVVQPSLVDFLK